MLDLSLDLTFYQCRGITGNDNIRPLADILFDTGFTFEQLADERMRQVNQREQIEALVKRHYLVVRTDRKTNAPIRWRTLFKAYPRTMQDLIGHFEFLQIDLRSNRLCIGALVDFEFTDQRSYVKPYTQRLKQLIVAVYSHAQPELGWIDRADRNTTDETDVRKQRLLTISWINVFGPAYVEHYGSEFLMGLPGYRTERLPDGGVFHQLSEQFVVADQKEGRAIRNQVKSYCAAQGLKVKCNAPYILPAAAATPQVDSPAEGMDFEAYLDQALGTTLIRDDGTRVKVLFIDWVNLTPGERETALHKISQAALTEAQHVAIGQRVRFEFNDLPDDLTKVLCSLGENGASVEWTEIDMECLDEY